MNKSIIFLLFIILPHLSYAYTVPTDINQDYFNKYDCFQFSSKKILALKENIKQDIKNINSLRSKIDTTKFELYIDKLAMEDKLRDIKAQLDKNIINSMVEDNLLDLCVRNIIPEIRLEQEKDKIQADLEKYTRDQEEIISSTKKIQVDMLNNSLAKNNVFLSGTVINSPSPILAQKNLNKIVKKSWFKFKKRI